MWRQMDYAAQKAQRKMEKRAAKHWCENEPAAFLTLFCDVLFSGMKNHHDLSRQARDKTAGESPLKAKGACVLFCFGQGKEGRR
jgi:hypothetical protein|eukprot:COSAG06_NODE_1338_length_9815_cov_25.206258_8_plen_84_part_00